jgi:hypothetical protein
LLRTESDEWYSFRARQRNKVSKRNDRSRIARRFLPLVEKKKKKTQRT